METDVEICRRMIAENAPGRPIRLGITEWNTTGGDWGLSRAMLWTLADTARADERDAANSWHEPERIRTESSRVPLVGAELMCRFPPLSLTVLEARRAGPAK